MMSKICHQGTTQNSIYVHGSDSPPMRYRLTADLRFIWINPWVHNTDFDLIQALFLFGQHLHHR